MQKAIIQVRGLAKRFGDVQAVAGMDFGLLVMFCGILFAVSLKNIRRRWIA